MAVISRFRFVEDTFVYKSVPFQQMSGAGIMRIAVCRDQMQPQYVKSIINTACVASEAIPFPQWHSFSQYPNMRVWGFSRLGSEIMPIEPTRELFSFRIIAKTPSFPINTVCRIFWSLRYFVRFPTGVISQIRVLAAFKEFL